MSQPVNSDNNSATSPKEMSMEVRLLLAFLLMGAVMFLSPYFFKSQAPAPAKKTAATGPAATGSVAPAPPPPATTTSVKPAPPVTASAVPSPNATPQQPLPPLIIDTDLYKVTF